VVAARAGNCTSSTAPVPRSIATELLVVPKSMPILSGEVMVTLDAVISETGSAIGPDAPNRGSRQKANS
jgi:hypothetical protein